MTYSRDIRKSGCKIEEEDGTPCLSEQGVDVPLPQVFDDRVVVCEVSVVDQSFVEANEG